jgi:hypothetical protein
MVAQGWAAAPVGQLSQSLGRPQIYAVGPGTVIQARYGSLGEASAPASKGSADQIAFARLVLPDGLVLVLPQVVSASGARYSDEREWQWWIKGDTARLDRRDASGQWVGLYSDCRLKP